MAKVLYEKKNTLRVFGIKVFDFNSQYLERSTEADTEEIREDIRLHERMGGNDVG